MIRAFYLGIKELILNRVSISFLLHFLSKNSQAAKKAIVSDTSGKHSLLQLQNSGAKKFSQEQKKEEF